jgi:hypothetical protein
MRQASCIMQPAAAGTSRVYIVTGLSCLQSSWEREISTGPISSVVAHSGRKKHASLLVPLLPGSRTSQKARSHAISYYSSFSRFRDRNTDDRPHATTLLYGIDSPIYDTARGDAICAQDRRGNIEPLSVTLLASRVAKLKCSPYATGSSHTRCTSSPCSSKLARALRFRVAWSDRGAKC